MSAGEASASSLSDADFDEVFTAEGLIGDGSPLLLAVSGGPDSTALMHAAAAWMREAGGPPLLVATVDHGLRRESRAEAEEVRRQATALKLPHAVLAWADRPDGAVSQSEARDARYRLMVEHAVAIGATRIATAHTFDDQVETILMRLADGSGLSGLAGMASLTQRGPVAHLRPFLHLKKAMLVATCRARGWSFVEDPTNRDPRFARPRWRALAAALASEGLTPERIVRLGGRLRRADLALEAMAEDVADKVIRDVQPSFRLRRGGPSQSVAEDRGGGASRELDDLGSCMVESALPTQNSAVAEFCIPKVQAGQARLASGGRVGGDTTVTVDFAALAVEPDEIVLRVIIRALRRAGASQAHLRLERVESACAALTAARMTGSALRRTLAGCVLSLDRAGLLTITPETPRRRGR